MPPIPPYASRPSSPPRLRYELQIQDLDHEGADVFLNALGPNPRHVLQRSVAFVRQTLYDEIPLHLQPNVESITFILRPMPGVAHSCGSDRHKEIHFSLDYIKSLSPAIAPTEIEGVIVHEVVHCFQYNARGTCPGGLIEGIADFIRLRANFAPPHWREDRDGKWDAGYEKTGYFLHWIENRQANSAGLSFVKDLNLAMKDREFDASIFQDMTGRSLKQLWTLYGKDKENN
ncbi:hypothetical protein AX14_001212 [Amanita brunnescens Koide BX004]|nr:hypothetical protein AX14_001212 [Amanita brunnescens Koide BX004]